MRSALRRIYTAALYVIAALALTAAVAISAFRVFVPMVPGYRAELEQWVSRAAQRPVHIGEISARWEGLGPELDLYRVAVAGAEGGRPLRLKEVRIGFSLWRMLRTASLRPSSISVAGAHLEVVRTAAGGWQLAGLSRGGGRTAPSWRAAVPLVLAYGRLRVIDSTVTLRLANRPAARQTLTDVRAELSSNGRHHRLAASARLPADLGDRIRVVLDAEGAIRQPRKWTVQATVSGRGLRPGHYLDRLLPDTVDVSRLRLNVDAHARWRQGKLHSARADIEARHLALHPGGGFAPETIRRLSGRFAWTRLAAGWRLQGRHVRLQTAHDRWPATDFALALTRADGHAAQWEGRAGFIRLQDVARIAAAVPGLAPGLRQRLERLQLRGDLSDTRFQVAPGGLAAGGLSVQTRFADVGWQVDGPVPGVSGLSGVLAMHGDRGHARIATHRATYTQPRLFGPPIQFDTATASASWKLEGGIWRVRLGNLDLANGDAAVSASGELQIPAAGGKPVVDLRAQLKRARATAIQRYLPRGRVPERTIAWLQRAVKAGRITGGELRLRGPLKAFPFRHGEGEFRVSARVQGAVLDYAPRWPEVSAVNGQVVFDRNSLKVAVRQARIAGMTLSGATASIADLRHADVRIRADVSGDNSGLVEVLKHSPLRGANPGLIDALAGSGPATVKLALGVPLARPQEARVRGTVDWDDATLALAGTPVRLSHLRGRLSFTRTRFEASGLTARFKGHPVTLQVQPEPSRGGGTLVTARGTIDARGIEALDPQIPKGVMHGATQWAVKVEVPPAGRPASGGLTTRVTSDLKGLAVALPGPLRKDPGSTRDLRVRVAADGPATRLVRLDYGGVLTGRLRLRRGDRGWRLDRGGLRFGGGPATLPAAPGLRVRGHLDRISLPAVAQLRSRLGGAGGGGLAGLPARLRTVDLSIGQVDGLGSPVKDVVLRYRRLPHVWRVGVQSRPLAGTLDIPRDGRGPWTADLDHIRIGHAGGKATGKGQRNAGSAGRKGWLDRLSPASVPPLDIRSREVTVDGRSYGSLDAHLRPSGSGVRLTSLKLSKPNLDISATGTWDRHAAGHQLTHVDVRLASDDPRAALDRLGFAAPLKAQQAHMHANLDWPGGPMDFSFGKVAGTLTLDIRNGSLLNVNPGAGRIFGLFSLYALPRRLNLDFGDVFGKGLAFDRINGDFVLRGGNAYTSDLVLDGPAAKVAIDGRIGLVARDFDQKIIVTPSLSSSIAIAGGLAGGPVVGAVLFLAQQLLRRPLGRVSEVRYHLTGSWSDPKVEKVGDQPLHVPDRPGEQGAAPPAGG